MVQMRILDGTAIEIAEDDLRTLAAGAAVILPGDDAYAEACSIWNGTVMRCPAAFARCRTSGEVATAIGFARDRNLRLSICGGGHNVAGSSLVDEGLVIDLREMRTVDVDTAEGVVRAGGGATIGDVDAATAPHGLAVPLGVVSETGIAGLTLGGGLGWLRRKHGLSSDNLVEAEVVTANGDTLTASAHENADLFWALQGGGGNFGVVTRFTLRAVPVAPAMPFCFVMHPIAEAGAGLRLFRETAPPAPDAVSAFAVMWSVPDIEDMPAEHRGKDTLIFVAAWSGDAEEGERWFEPWRTYTTPFFDGSGTIPYTEVQQFFDADYPRGARYYWKSNYLADLSDGAINRLVEHTIARPSKESTLDVWQLGGAMGRVEPAASAYPYRDAPYLLGIEANWHDPAQDDANMAWGRSVYTDMQQFAHGGGVYINFPGHGEEGQSLVRAAYGANYDRLAKVKAQYDPGNLFRQNLNVLPAR